MDAQQPAGLVVPAAAFAAIGAVSKAPFFHGGGVVQHLAVAAERRAPCAGGCCWQGPVWRRWPLFWPRTHRTDALASQAVLPVLRAAIVTEPADFYWYFGDLHTRLNPRLWLAGSWRFLHATVGALPLTVLLLAGLAGPGNRLAKLWLLGTLATTLVFTHVILVQGLLLPHVLPRGGLALWSDALQMG